MKQLWPIAMLCLSCQTNTPSTNPTSKPSCQEKPSKVSFDNAPLSEIVSALSQTTCKSFVVAEELKSEKLSLFVEAPLNTKEIIDGFRLSLGLNQLMLKEDGGAYTIVANKEEPTSTQPTSKETTQLAVTIESAELESRLKDPEGLAKEARFVPSMKDDAFNGFKVFAIRAPSFFATLGLQNGDLIQRVNGAPLDSIEKALSLVPKAEKTKGTWSVSLIRKGAPVELIITVK